MRTNSITSIRSSYARVIDANVRSFGAYLNEVKRDVRALNLEAVKAEAAAAAADAKAAAAAAAEAAKAAKAADATDEAKAAAAATKAAAAAAKAKAEAAATRYAEAERRSKDAAVKARIEAARTILDGARLSYEDITPAFIKTWIPQSINEDGKICDLQRVKLENEEATREAYKENPAALREIDGNLFILKPVTLWTASKLLTKFAKAARERDAAARYASQLERDAAREAKQKAREDAILARAAEIAAKRAAAEAKQNEEAAETATDTTK